MPAYEYACQSCGLNFERRQAITDPPLAECPGFGGEVRRLISGGAGLVLKGPGRGKTGRAGQGCSLKREGRTCCGRGERCGKSPCGGGS